MLKSLVIGASLVLTLAACATVAPTQEVAKRASLVPAGTPLPPRGCVTDTGTRIPLRAGECAGFGESYSRDDLERTGQYQLGPALQILDPSLTVHGH